MKRIPKYLALVFLTLLSGRLSAQDAALIAKLYETFSRNLVCLSVDYSIEMNGTLVKGKGDVRVQKDSYHMDGVGYDIYCDGKSVWIMDERSKEVIIEPVSNGLDADVSNPALLLSRLEDEFDIKSVKGMTYTLAPKRKGGITSARITLSGDGKITSAEFSMSDGNVLKVTVNKMSVSALEDVTSFRPGTVFDKSWIVTDLR